jgi:hypothetical protein
LKDATISQHCAEARKAESFDNSASRGGVSSYTFGDKRTADIFKTPPFIHSIFLKTIPIHI